MWSKQQAVAEPPAVSPSAAASTPVVGFNQPSTGKPSSAPARGGARLGASIQIRGEVTGSEDLQIDGIVEGPIRIKGHELTVGPAAQLTSEIHAGDVVASSKRNAFLWSATHLSALGGAKLYPEPVEGVLRPFLFPSCVFPYSRRVIHIAMPSSDRAYLRAAPVYIPPHMPPPSAQR